MEGGIFEIFKISGEGLSLQRRRLSSIAKNIANANTTKTPEGGPYKREIVVARQVHKSDFQSQFEIVLKPFKSGDKHLDLIANKTQNKEYIDAEILQDNTVRLVYDPSHPDADENGYVRYPNVNVVTEMVEMISAQRAFEANVSVIEATKNIARDSLDI